MVNTIVFQKVFRGLEERTLDVLREVTTSQTYPPGTVLCRQGEIEETFYIVVSGRVSVTRTETDGEEHLLAMCGPNDYFGELALLDKRPRMATCTTVVETTVLEITAEVFARLVEESPAVATAITNQVLATMRDLDRRALETLAAKNEALQEAYKELQAAQAELVEKERLERELEIAAEVQRSLLPAQLPQYAGYRFAAYLEPARHVGGDYYDVIELDDDQVALVMADVVDKSVHAALFMAVTRTLFRTASRTSSAPAEVALAVHAGMMDTSTAEMFVTAFYGVLHRSSGRLRYVVAGQERPLLARPGQPVCPLEGRGRFLGMIDPLRLTEYTLEIEKGDRLLLFSDGLTDAPNQAGERYGYNRLEAALGTCRAWPVAELVNYIAEDVQAWCQGVPAFDDITLLAVERKEQ
ncbi:MAG: SpoIIE family protein phosphatase [Candidatus Promineifilaceae bacterium]|nr:SpoIIE family protein phosphatase [Candidatus Promineifilaceae bacterium]